MPNEGLNITATAKVKITKLDEYGNVIGTDERVVELTKKEAEELWQSQQQE